MKDLPIKLKIFLFSLYVFTAITIYFQLNNKVFLNYALNYTEIIFFGIILAVAESLRIVYKGMAISTSFAIQLAMVLIFGPIVGSIIVILGLSLRFKKVEDKYQNILYDPIYKTLYNYCVVIIPIVYASLIYSKLGGSFDATNLWSKIHLIIAFSIVYLLLNTLLISILFSLLNHKNLFYFFLSNVKLSLLSGLVMTPFGILLAYMFYKYSFGGVLLIVFPIVLVRYTFYLYLEAKTQYVQTVDTLMNAMEARDKYTEGHSRRVSELSVVLAKELRYGDSKIERIRMASLLHDVGKIGIDDNILNKPGKLTNEEYETIKSHPKIGYNILKNIKNLEDILPIIRNHHERYDGSGYPDCKNSDSLQLDVFIVQLADSIDAMATDRPYRRALSEGEIISELIKFKGTQFHPKVVDAYMKVMDKRKQNKVG